VIAGLGTLRRTFTVERQRQALAEATHPAGLSRGDAEHQRKR
jgi:hypothetical protein